ncbi:hypothetical protein DIE23_33565 [Burkholderia sp. Bp9143]|uniref:hypothetical protein n=1 Tax=Burkholderia sp. Bp9143 TaxID=2184574 RepID=UPI000F591AF4|nr:hypothetical protein [Burkholderia sp. Bp9143]RQR24485.1 hypothetical protein DIE23_33565 [Burkholderia sp. Bp9143]
METIWHLEWTHGAFDVHAKGGMLGGVSFALDGRTIRPFYEAPWLGRPEPQPAGLLGAMRSEFPCVPFGVPYAPDGLPDGWREAAATPMAAHDASDDLQHGYGCVGTWSLVKQTALDIEIAIDYPEHSPIRRLTRIVRADPSRAALDIVLRIDARAPARRPAGLHPNLALPELAGAFRIEPGAFRFGIVHPAGPEPGVSRARAGAMFDALDRVPLADGGTGAFDRLPLADATEEIVQLCGIDGAVTLTDDDARTRYRLTWDADALPSLLLWISNRGRTYAPWNGRNLCVGIEPVASAFELGCAASLASNPINAHGVNTALALRPDAPTEIAYRFEVLDTQ